MTEEIYAQVSWKRGDDIFVLHAPDGTMLYALADTFGLKEATEELMNAIKTGKAVPSAAHSNGSTEIVDIDTVVLGQGGENPMWYVKGGNFKMHGIPLWKEPIEEAGLTLDPMKENKLPGWKAEYTLKPKQEGDGMTPKKVVRLIPPGVEQKLEDIGYPQEPKKTAERPLPPEKLKAGLQKRAAEFGAKTAGPAMRKFLAGMLNGMLGDDTARHAFLYWLNGTQSMNDCPDGMCYALSAWIDADDEYNPNKFADVEAKAAYNFIMEEQGQQKLPVEPFPF